MSSRRGYCLGLVVSLSLFAIACGKSRAHTDASDEGATLSSQTRWDPPTPENGFHRVLPVDCAAANADVPHVDVDDIEEIARLRGIASSVTADRSGIYWAAPSVGSAPPERARTVVYRALRVGERWSSEPIARPSEHVSNLVTAGNYVYWIAGGGHEEVEGIRCFSKLTGTVSTLAVESNRPTRLVAEGESAFWIAPPNHLREGHGREPHEVRELLTNSFTSSALAVDAGSVYAFTDDRSLLRIPRDGARPTVLLSSTQSRPIDLAVDGSWIYWLEEGPACAGGSPVRLAGYRMEPDPHPKGVLRRIPLRGGTNDDVEDLATGLLEAKTLTLRGDLALVTTKDGLFEVSLVGPRRPKFLSLPVDRVRPALFSGRVLVASSSATAQPSVVLLSPP